MKYLQTYIKYLSDKGNPELAASVSDCAKKIGNDRLSNFSYTSHEIGLLFGNVQSGKTGQMFGILCQATDMGFLVFLVLTTDNIALQQQTLKRAESDLKNFCICGENDSGKFIANNLVQPTIVILKKNARILRLWANVFATTGFMKGNPLFILDDEADAASLNTLVNKNRQSSINRNLDKIKNDASCSLYLQITGTPQAVLLQTKLSGWHPYFTYYFEPGKGYLGGDFFFPSIGKPPCIEFFEDMDDPLKTAVLRHISVSSQVLSSGGKVCNFMIHPGVRQAEHQAFASKTKRIIEDLKNMPENEFENLFKTAYSELSPSKSQKIEWNQYIQKIRDILSGGILKIFVMNGLYDVSGDDYSEGSNIVVGGNTLGRGITFPQLQTIYYSRAAKKPQADTMWQHSRMFGYDRDPGIMKVYISKPLYKLFTDINATNESLISQIQSNIDDIKVWYPAGLNPTRPGVLDNRYVDVISGGTNYYPNYPDNVSYEDVDKLLAPFSENESSYSVNLRLIKEILEHIQPSDDFDKDAFISVIETMTAETPAKQGVLIVRRDRDVTQGTGALISQNDWALGKSFKDKTVLTMYQVRGNKGWKRQPLWVPNIKLPDGMVYYNVQD